MFASIGIRDSKDYENVGNSCSSNTALYVRFTTLRYSNARRSLL